MALKQTEAIAIWCLGERGELPFTELQRHTGQDRRSLWRAVQALMRKRLVRPSDEILEGVDTIRSEPPSTFRLTRRGRCVYDLLRTLESHVAAA